MLRPGMQRVTTTRQPFKSQVGRGNNLQGAKKTALFTSGEGEHPTQSPALTSPLQPTSPSATSSPLQSKLKAERRCPDLNLVLPQPREDGPGAKGVC